MFFASRDILLAS